MKKITNLRSKPGLEFYEEDDGYLYFDDQIVVHHPWREYFDYDIAEPEFEVGDIVAVEAPNKHPMKSMIFSKDESRYRVAIPDIEDWIVFDKASRGNRDLKIIGLWEDLKETE